VLVIETGATPYIYVPVSSPLADPTGLAVDLAMVQQDTVDPGTSDWKAATWRAPTAAGAKEVAYQYDPAIWPPGEYMCFVRIHASPELLVLRAGRVRVGDTRGTAQ
jgi:hypothetical protein